jgi:hypothetical protein
MADYSRRAQIPRRLVCVACVLFSLVFLPSVFAAIVIITGEWFYAAFGGLYQYIVGVEWLRFVILFAYAYADARQCTAYLAEGRKVLLPGGFSAGAMVIGGMFQRPWSACRFCVTPLCTGAGALTHMMLCCISLEIAIYWAICEYLLRKYLR